MYTVGDLAKVFGVSRSTLLYYDKICLLEPSTRSEANYRHYSQADFDRLNTITVYRKAGLPLADIRSLLDARSDNQRVTLLTTQVDRLNDEIADLRRQQQTVLELLGHSEITQQSRSITKQQWVDLLRSIGLSDEEMDQWHIEFERRMPDAHQDFLESLNIAEDEVTAIRERSQRGLRLVNQQ